ncbi:MAG: DNA adenine methylase [Clostridia bacterium]
MSGKTPSPLRYPGGKIKIYNYVLNIIEKNNINNPIYVEPFAGGCSLALELLYNNKVKSIIINDLDYAIYSFWYSILNDIDNLINLIINTELTIEEWYRQKEIYLNQSKYTKLEIAFATLFLNRTNRSGIITAGPIGGKNQDGNYKIDCRFNKDTIIEKLLKINSYKKKIKLYNLDAEQLLLKIYKSKKENYFVYLDPPYFVKGPCLYKNCFDEDKHISLYSSIDKYLANINCIISYDSCDEIKNIYSKYKQVDFSLNYSAGTNKTGNEIMIFNNMLTAIEYNIKK